LHGKQAMPGIPVSESVLDKVFQYIKNQKQHHKKINFQKEYEDFIRLHGLQNEVENG
jgi:putative transposase